MTTQSEQHTSSNADAVKIPPPKRFGVFLLNDDITTMDFVVEILIDIFSMNHERAMAVMLLVHHQGRGLCGVYNRDIAETKQEQVINRAKEAGFPLKCIIEEMK